MTSDTRTRIQDAARELFARKGVQRTSLQEIADSLGITKPALYYHFASREALVRSIVQPLIDEGEEFVRAQEADPPTPRGLLEGYFDLHYRHRNETILLLTESSTLVELDLIDTVLTWRGRLATLLVGNHADLQAATRAVVALGGLQDCTIHFRDVPADDLREAAVTAALAALGH
ncbi:MULTISPECIES: TetR/AcrR family transcriptional regulator [Actinokineospora]|uniref:TetR family transcriptional regulator n=1 Tax=Actinokineospora fastidiosa TaxID=1816 RepID=A0A918GS30_9PSEU|nr:MULTISPECIES: TetR/AcrR family transcriptional regulator [Actinokineospora]UVS81530.1 HTH-type transcriptional regulator MtrR [Actinokineospora sp. UTMC 2448]GGS57442.1 TetR family transcriptional regulator [Actinokineospora fastidiosa]